MCSEGEVMSAALPAHFKISSESILVFNETFSENDVSLTDEEYLVMEALQIRKQLQIQEIQQILEGSHVYPVIKSLLNKRVCTVWEQLSEKYKPRKENFVELAPHYHQEEHLASVLNEWKGAPKQMELLLAFLHLQKAEGYVVQSELIKKADASSAQLKALCEKGILFVVKRIVDRITMLPEMINIDFQLSEQQKKALDSVNDCFKKKNVCLLHGVTGSGKTQLYIEMIAEAIRMKKQVLYLLPEIALTAQIIRRLQHHFGGHIAIYHSKFNDQERIEIWNNIRNNKVSVVLGARSSLFLPFSNLGLIIVDEEHDSSYKQQDPAPRYNARDAAIYYASLFNAKVLLGSGTPSLESYHNAVQDKYGFVKLMERFGGLKLPEIDVVQVHPDKQKGKVMIGEELHLAIEASVRNKKQVILFQNRRGYNPYLFCGTCGFIPQCNHCDVSLTLHKQSHKLHCHYCGSSYPPLTTCTACGSSNWLEKNFGTEKIEEQLELDFPGYRIARMDIDSVRGKNAHDALIQLFEKHQLDILVGTQMVVKGLDFEKVELVGILDADGLLSFADFRVNERAFQLMEQVSGRAGRKGEQGKVVIQAINIKHPVIQWVKEHDYEKMFHAELSLRKEFFYPPYCRLVVLTLKHKDSRIVRMAAEKLSGMLRTDLKENVVGPAQPVIPRLRNLYHMEIMIKLPRESASGLNYKKAIRHHINLLQSEKQYKSVTIIANADPQ
jgi:primosomal protein N' (replication factor Y)